MGAKVQVKSYGSRGGKRIVNLAIDEETARYLLYLLTAALGGRGGLKDKEANGAGSPKSQVGSPKGVARSSKGKVKHKKH